MALQYVQVPLTLMDLHPLASIDTPALIRQLLASRAQESLGHLHALREALDAAVRGIEAPSPAGDDDIQGLAATLTSAAREEIARCHEEAARQLQALRGELQAALTQNAFLDAALGDAQTERGRLEGELQNAREHAEALNRDLALAAQAHAGAEGALRAAREELSRAAQERASLAGDLETAGALMDQAATRNQQLQTEIGSLAAHQAALLAQLSALEGVRSERDTLASALEERHHTIREFQAAHEQVHAQVRDLEVRLGASAACEATLRDELAARDGALRIELETARLLAEERAVLAAAVETGRARIESLEAELAASAEYRAQRDDLAVRLEESSGRLLTLEAELAASAEYRTQRDDLTVRLEENSGRLLTLEAELAASAEYRAHRDDLAVCLQERDERVRSLDAEILEVRAHLDQACEAERELRERLAEADTVRRDVDRLMSLFEASANAAAEMSSASGSTELLLELTKHLSGQFSRVALFRVTGDRLKSEGQLGFDEPAGLSALALPLTLDSIITSAIRTKRIESLSGEEVPLRSGLPFAGSPTYAIALPVLLHGTPIAVVYADDWGRRADVHGPAVHAATVTFARLLLEHAGVLLLRHTQELKTLAELSEYADTLLDEVRVVHRADIESGKAPEIVRRRLRDNLDYACQLYAYRAAMEGTTAAALLDEQIAGAIREGTPFSRDLAAVAGGTMDGSALATDSELLISDL